MWIFELTNDICICIVIFVYQDLLFSLFGHLNWLRTFELHEKKNDLKLWTWT